MSAAEPGFSGNAEKEINNMVRKVIMITGFVLLIGGVGYSEMPGGNFWAGIAEAFLGMGMIQAMVITAN